MASSEKNQRAAKDDSSSDSSIEDYVDRMRKSIDEIREFYPHDARKAQELRPSIDQYRPSVEYRKSLDVDRMPEKGKGRPSVAAARLEPIAPVTAERKSLEKTFDDAAHAPDDKDALKNIPKSEGLTAAQAEQLLQQYGRNELPEKITPKWLVFLQLLVQPLPIIIWVCAIVELGLLNWVDTIVLVAINLINAGLSFYESMKAGNAVAALKGALKPTAVVKRDGKWDQQFDARLLVPGDLIELNSGNVVPADCMINEGQIEVDESALTGEAIPVAIHERELAKMSGTVARGETTATVVFTGEHTFLGKAASLLANTKTESNLHKLLIKVVVILGSLSSTLLIIAFIYLLATGQNFKQALGFLTEVLIASVPLAIEIVTTTTLAIGSTEMAKFGAIVKRLAAIEDLAGLNMLCSDKTGTLTKNKMVIQNDAPTYMPGLTQLDLLKQAALAAKWDSPPKDALDTLVLRCHLWSPEIDAKIAEHVAANPNISITDKEAWRNEQIGQKLATALADFESLAYVPFDPRVKRTEGTVREKSTGKIFKVTKGAPHILLHLDTDKEKAKAVEAKVMALGEDGIRAMALAISDPITDKWVIGKENKDIQVTWHVTGLLTFLDPPRDDTKETIAKAQALGVPVRMITGDHLLVAKKTCKDLDMGDKTRAGWPNMKGPERLPTLMANGHPPPDLVQHYGDDIRDADGFAQVFPEHKFLIVETYRQLGFKTGMTGDGVNDAPALKRADVGVAVAGATEAARAAAHIVLTQEGLSTIVLGITIARKIFARLKSFLTYRIAATLQILFFFFIAVFAFHPERYVRGNTTRPEEWPAYFHMPVIFLILITVINDGTLIAVGYDNATPSAYPDRWILPILFLSAAVLSGIACLSSLLFLHVMLDSWNPHGLFQHWGIGGLQYGQIINAMFLQLAVIAVLMLYSSRTAHEFFFQRRPHPILMVATGLALTISTVLALVWPCSKLRDINVCGIALQKGQKLGLWIWIYNIVVFIIMDIVKVLMWKLIIRYNLWNVNNRVEGADASSKARGDDAV